MDECRRELESHPDLQLYLPVRELARGLQRIVNHGVELWHIALWIHEKLPTFYHIADSEEEQRLASRGVKLVARYGGPGRLPPFDHPEWADYLIAIETELQQLEMAYFLVEECLRRLPVALTDNQDEPMPDRWSVRLNRLLGEIAEWQAPRGYSDDFCDPKLFVQLCLEKKFPIHDWADQLTSLEKFAADAAAMARSLPGQEIEQRILLDVAQEPDVLDTECEEPTIEPSDSAVEEKCDDPPVEDRRLRELVRLLDAAEKHPRLDMPSTILRWEYQLWDETIQRFRRLLVQLGDTNASDPLTSRDLRLKVVNRLCCSGASSAEAVLAMKVGEVLEHLQSAAALMDVTSKSSDLTARAKDAREDTPACSGMADLLAVFTNGVSDDRFRNAESLLADESLTVNDKLTKINSLLKFPATATAEKLGKLLGVSKQAVMKTQWWIENRRGQKDELIDRRQAATRERAKLTDSMGKDIRRDNDFDGN